MSFSVAAGESCRSSALGLRQIDGLQHHRRPRRRLRGQSTRGRRRRVRDASRHRHGVSGRIDVSMAQCSRERCVSPRNRRYVETGAPGPGRAFRVDGRPSGFRAALSRRTVRWHAPACRTRPHAGLETEAAPDGRAVRRTRRADATAARRQGAPDPANAQADDAADHTQSHGSRAVVRSGSSDDLPAWPPEARRKRRIAPPTRLRSG